MKLRHFIPPVFGTTLQRKHLDRHQAWLESSNEAHQKINSSSDVGWLMLLEFKGSM
jgi:hypothetical protein